MCYKLLIVDDEQKIRAGLKRIIKWKELGFEVIGEACNGRKALEFIKNGVCPDVILTDIRMPLMDGLEFMQKVKKDGYGVEIVILSGYDYFEYAQKAIELGAFDYILKPTEVDELTSKFLKLKEKLDSEREGRAVVEKSRELIKEECIKDLIYHSYKDMEEIIRKMQYGDVFIGNSWFVAAALRISCEDEDYSIAEIKGEIEKYINDKFKCFIIIDSQRNIVCMFVDNSINNRIVTDDKVERLLREIRNSVLKSYTYVTIGIGSRLKGIDNVSISYNQALKALEMSFFRGVNSIILFSSCKNQMCSLEYSLNMEKKLISSIEEMDKTKSAIIVKDMFEQNLSNECVDPVQIYKICIEMIAVISRHFESLSETIDRVFDENRILYKKLADFETLQQLKNWFKERIYIIIDLLQDRKDNTHSRIVYHIKNIISKKYHEQISLVSIADSLYMNPDYLRRLFKRETGQSFVEYLTNYRIEMAKELFKDVSSKNYEVGFRVGYNDPNYFSNVFKKVTGKSITQYREQLINR